MKSSKKLAIACASTLAYAAALAPTLAQAQATGGSEPTTVSGIQEIVVTAQKRAENINEVPLTVTAITGDTMVQKGVLNPADLVKFVPGFTFTEAPRGAPVYAIRGIGFDDSTLGSASTVAVYTDEVPLSYPVETRFATLDLERVEILKGPQGILFGQNSTGGAINFIAAKPTEELTAGFDLSYGRFNTIDARGFMSGRVSDTLKMRFSAMSIQSGDWQKSASRSDTLGEKHQFAGRLIAEWEPTEAAKLTVNINGWVDRSDTQGVQLLEVLPLLPVSQAANPGWVYPNEPRTVGNARITDWDPVTDPENPLERDDNFFQASLRGDFELTDQFTLTSISALARYNQRYSIDVDGSDLQDFIIGDKGRIRSFNQELRLAGDFGRVKFIVGGNYAKDRTRQENRYLLKDSSVFYGFLGNTNSRAFFEMPIRDVAVFGNLDFEATDRLTFHAGVRYTEDKRTYTGCTQDGGDGVQGGIFNIIIGAVFNPPNAPPPDIQPGGCTSSNVVQDPVIGQYFDPGLKVETLKENNVSWRAGMDFKATPDVLLYTMVSKGYKSGSFPAVNVASNLQLEGVKQESVLAYEVGIKAGLMDNRLQVNSAVFYNDYKNKQLRGRILDPFGFFGILDKLLNVPKSRVYGAEVAIEAVPVDGLKLGLAGTYTNSKVTKDFFAYDPVQSLINYKGLQFPHTPEWNFSGSADYEWSIANERKMFVGSTVSYRSKTIALFANRDILETEFLDATNRPGVTVPRDAFDEKAYAVVDAQIGVGAADNSWRAWVWGKNIFNTYYWHNSTQSFDSIYRIAAMPATYGASVSFRF